MRGENRDYIPTRERGAGERMKANSSMQDGLSGRIEADKRGARYREYYEKGVRTPEKKFQGMFDYL